MILNFKNRKSEFELIHIKWVGIQYDRKKLKKFIRRYNILRILSIFSKTHKHELKVFRKIIKRHGEEKLRRLLENDENTSRICHIERISRIGSSEILTIGTYTPETYRLVTNLPKNDYDLVTKRTQELISIGQSMYVQNDNFTDTIPTVEN